MELKRSNRAERSERAEEANRCVGSDHVRGGLPTSQPLRAFLHRKASPLWQRWGLTLRPDPPSLHKGGLIGKRQVT